MAKKRKKIIGKQCHEQNNRPHRKEQTVGRCSQTGILDIAARLDKFRKEGANDRLSTLASMVYLMKMESARITAEISVLLEEYGLNNGTLLKAVERFEREEDRLYTEMQSYMLADKETIRRLREDADRFDRDIYRYMGLPITWKANEPTQTSYTVGVQNFIGVGGNNEAHGQNCYIGRDADNRVWVSQEDDCRVKAILPETMFPEIKQKEYYLMAVQPKVYVDSHR